MSNPSLVVTIIGKVASRVRRRTRRSELPFERTRQHFTGKDGFQKRFSATMATRLVTKILRFRAVECPNCNERFILPRSRTPTFDSAGFESYKFDCNSCGTI